MNHIESGKRTAMPGDLLLHPVAIAAMLVVIFNDRYLKVYHAGFVSGKLSDFTGLIYFPLFLVSVAEISLWIRARLSKSSNHQGNWQLGSGAVDSIVAVTGIIFTLAKLWDPAAIGYSVVFGVVWWPVDALASLSGGAGWPPVGRLSLTQDPLDLVALPMLLVPMLIVRRLRT